MNPPEKDPSSIGMEKYEIVKAHCFPRGPRGKILPAFVDLEVIRDEGRVCTFLLLSRSGLGKKIKDDLEYLKGREVYGISTPQGYSAYCGLVPLNVDTAKEIELEISKLSEAIDSGASGRHIEILEKKRERIFRKLRSQR